MKQALVLLLGGLCALAGACNPPAPMPPVAPIPPPPPVQTEAGGQCVRECMALYNQCTGSIHWSATGADQIASAKAGAIRSGNACKENLGNCYTTCR
jgi:hypothetical protein